MFALRSLLLFVVLVLSLLGCSTGNQRKEQAYSHFKLGVTNTQQGQYAMGLQHLLKATELDPDNPLYANHLGLTYFFMKELELAVTAFKAAINKKPDYSEAHNNLGRVYIDLREFSLARQHLTRASEDLAYPNKDKVWLNLGLSYFFERQYQASENYFLKSISMNRENCLAYNYYGRAQVELENYKKAAKVFDQAIYHCRKSGFDEPHYYGAIALFRLGYKDKAIARLQEGKKLFPSGPNRDRMDEMISLMKITKTK